MSTNDKEEKSKSQYFGKDLNLQESLKEVNKGNLLIYVIGFARVQG